MPQTTLWRFLLKRDSSAISVSDEETGNNNNNDSFDIYPPTPKRAKNLMMPELLNENGTSAADFTPSPISLHVRSRMLSSPGSPMDCDDNQMILDCGQKMFGPELCAFCGMFYTPVHGKDTAVHERYHRQLLTPAKLHRRLQQASVFQCVQELPDGFIYKCDLKDPLLRQERSQYRQFVDDILARMNLEMDSGVGNKLSAAIFDKPGRQMYLFVGPGQDRFVYGALIVEQIKYAYRYSAEGYTDEQPQCALMGVNRIWTWSDARRRRIATRLVDCARCNFVVGYVIGKKHVAFSEPTANGLQFVKSYCCSANESFLVYRLS